MANFVSSHLGGGYNSELEDESAKNPSSQIKSDPLFKKPTEPALRSGHPTKQSLSATTENERRKIFGSNLRAMNAYERHIKFVNDYVIHYGRVDEYTKPLKPHKSDYDVLKENYQFIPDEQDDETSWEKRLAKKYYDKLFKEYCLADMTRYKESKIGLRWRTQNEVVSGKGQFICGNKACNSNTKLKSYEVNFAYVENKEKKNALVKLRLCPDCAYKLNYKQMKKEEKRLKKEKKKDLKRKIDMIEQSTEQPSQNTTSENNNNGQTDTVSAIEQTGQPKQSLEELEHNAWRKKPEVDKTREEEFDEYFEGLFL